MVSAAVRAQQTECVYQLKGYSVPAELCAKAKMRIESLFVNASMETGAGLPDTVSSDVSAVINGSHKTFRYMLFTGLLVAVTDTKLHPRCLQKSAKVEGAFDARSLCQKVVVPFEKTFLQGRLGASNEPYANKPARFEMIELGNKVRKGADELTLHRLYDILEYVRTSDSTMRTKVFCYALSLVLRRPPNAASVVTSEPVVTHGVDDGLFFDFLDAHTKGISAVATLAEYFRRFYGRDTKVIVHPATESGASSREVGDIDLEFANGKRYAVEVKDKPFTRVDVMHACEKTLAAGVGKLVFAFGVAAEKSDVHVYAMRDVWAEKGLELRFLNIEDVLSVALCCCDAEDRLSFANGIYRTLGEMNAPDDVLNKFDEIFNGGK